MQIGEEAGSNPDLVDVSAHGTKVLKNLANVMLGISRKSSENKGESNELCLGDAYACGDLRGAFSLPVCHQPAPQGKSKSKATRRGHLPCGLISHHSWEALCSNPSGIT